MGGEAASGFAGPGVPGTAIQFVKFGEQIGGGEIFRVVLLAEDDAKVEENLQFRVSVGKIEDGDESSADFGGPGATSCVSNVNERFGALALSGSKGSGKIWWKVLCGLDEGGRGLLKPAAKTAAQGIEGGGCVVEPVAGKFL